MTPVRIPHTKYFKDLEVSKDLEVGIKNSSAAPSPAEGGGAARQNPYLDIPAMRLDTQDRSGEIEVQEGESPKMPLTDFEAYVLQTVKSGAKRISESTHAAFSNPLFYTDEDGDRYDTPSINDLWDQEPSFREYVKTQIVPGLNNAMMLNVTGFKKWLTSPRGIARYYKWADKEGYMVGPEPEPKIDPETDPNNPMNWLR